MLAIILSSCAAPNMKGSGKGGMPPVGLAQGNTAPDFSLKNIDGEDVKLSDYRGKIVIVNFFGVWCPWCVREMPGFVKVYNDYKDRGVELLVVDVGDSKQTLLNYLKTNNFSIKPVIDDKQEVSGKYQVNGYPTSYIIDSKGVIQRVHSGYMDEGSLRSILDSIINTH
jgi:peroxiredoxin